MLPLTLLPYTLHDGRAFPHYLTPRDEAWIRLLIDELDALVGRTHGGAAQILAAKTEEITARHDVPIAAVRAVRHLLERLWRGRPLTTVPSRQIRRVVFELGADPATPHGEIIRRAADVLGIQPEQVSEGMFADSLSERRLSAPREEPSPSALIDAYNFALVQEFLLRSEEVVVHVGAHAAPVLRVAKQYGLMYAFGLDSRGAVVTFPGPVSLFRETVRYGRALANLLAVVADVPNWSLDAKCLMGAKMARFHADASDPLIACMPKDVDNAVERRLFHDFRRLGSHWSMAHATEPLRGRDSTFFPDFTVERGTDRVPIEIIRFHTWAYVQTRLAALREAGLSSVLLCVDDASACSERGSPSTVQVFHFQKRVEVGRLLCAIERVVAKRDAPPDSDQPNS